MATVGLTPRYTSVSAGSHDHTAGSVTRAAESTPALLSIGAVSLRCIQLDMTTI